MKNQGHAWRKTKGSKHMLHCDKCKMVKPLASNISVCAFAELNVQVGSMWFSEKDLTDAIVFRMNMRSRLPQLIQELERMHKQCTTQL